MASVIPPPPHRGPMGAAVRACFQKYARFSGRAPRSEFWYFILFLIAGQILLIILNSTLFGPVVETTPDGGQSRLYTSGWFGTIFMLATFLPLLAVGWRRMHDLNLRGWWFIAPLILQFVLLWGTAIYYFGLQGLMDAFRQYGAVTFSFSGPGIGKIILLVLAAHVALIIALAWRGTKGPNRFGPDPLGGQA
ncbi:DUF805 domain-containing protein [Paracoccus aurantiacus]|uniref:DUF805 domain-containing protein n=1 Tax=Paracoccus aurantiacus TaxID=2599412 RepID=UPI00164C0714|nr:DUF805 domain-containing protein [Paracoccus aurantiacus]